MEDSPGLVRHLAAADPIVPKMDFSGRPTIGLPTQTKKPVRLAAVGIIFRGLRPLSEANFVDFR